MNAENPASPAKSIAVRPNLFLALRGLWLMTWRAQTAWRRLPILIVSVFVVPILVYITIDPGEQKSYLHWTIDFYFLLMLPLYCLTTCGGMIRDELQSDTLYFLTTRPISRARFFILKYLCHLAWLEIVTGLSLLLLLSAGLLRDITGVLQLGLWLLVAQFVAVFAWGALSALLGLASARYIVLGILYGFVIEIGIGRIPTNINSLSLTKNLQTILGNNDLIAGIYEWSPDKTGISFLILVCAALVFLGFGAALFTFKEYHHAEEVQK